MPRCEPAGRSPDRSRPGYLNSHLLFRMTRQLTQDGKPLPPGVLLHVKDRASGEQLLAGGLAVSKKGLLSYWPPVPARLMRPEAPEACLVDHATLVPSKGENHLTCYDSNDARCRPKKLNSQLIPFPTKQSGYRVWLIAAFTWEVMRDQLGFFEEWIPTPRSDEDRRKQEVVRFTNSLNTCQVSLPAPAADGNFFILELGLVDDPQKVPTMLPSLGDLESEAQGWAAPRHVGINVCRIGDVQVAVRTFLSGGALGEQVLVGLPRAKKGCR